jgi:hypothetical protein
MLSRIVLLCAMTAVSLSVAGFYPLAFAADLVAGRGVEVVDLTRAG